MPFSNRRIAAPAWALIAIIGWLTSLAAGAPAPTADPNAGGAKPEIVLPKDPKAMVLSYDPGAGGFIRKGTAPYLKIQADGQVTVTSLIDGSKKESKLTAKQLEELLRFVIMDQDFVKVTEAKIDAGIKAAAVNGPFIAIGGAGTAVIGVQANGKQHEVKYRGASAYLGVYPKVAPLAQFVAVEKRLAELGATVTKGK